MAYDLIYFEVMEQNIHLENKIQSLAKDVTINLKLAMLALFSKLSSTKSEKHIKKDTDANSI